MIVPGNIYEHEMRFVRERRGLKSQYQQPSGFVDNLEVGDPTVVRNFSQILMASVDVLIRIIHDLQKLDPGGRQLPRHLVQWMV